MSLGGHLKALFSPLRKRFIMAVLSHRVRAQNPTMDAHPTVIWDYGFGDLHALEFGKNVWIGPNVEILVYHRSPQSSVPGKLIVGNGSIIALGAEISCCRGYGSHRRRQRCGPVQCRGSGQSSDARGRVPLPYRMGRRSVRG